MNAIPAANELIVKSRALDVSIQSVLLAAWVLTQSSYTGSTQEATFGLWNSGRNLDVDGIETLAYPCMNVLPFRLEFSRGSSGKDIAQIVQTELKRRTPVIEQSSLVEIDGWVHGQGKPLHNVFVNILGLPGMGESGEEQISILRPMDVRPLVLIVCPRFDTIVF
jgi:ferricrocin synthase